MSDDDEPADDLADRLGLDDETGSDESGAAPDASADEPPTAEEEPLEALAERVRTRREYEEAEKAEETGESPFESMDVDEVDSEAVWEELFDEDGGVGEYIGVGGDAERTMEGAGYAEFIVEKAKFCKRCPFLGDPPALDCTHDGTEIVEVVDTEHFRVRDCPMVDDEGFTDI